MPQVARSSQLLRSFAAISQFPPNRRVPPFADGGACLLHSPCPRRRRRRRRRCVSRSRAAMRRRDGCWRAFAASRSLPAARGYARLRAFGACSSRFCAGVRAARQPPPQHRALHPPLRQSARGSPRRLCHRARSASIGTTRPFEIEGRLMADAAVTETGATLRVQRRARVALGVVPEPARRRRVADGARRPGGRRASASGAPAASFATPAVLRRPARYLNDGVPDQERLLARRGIALVGTVKSAALVQVVGRGSWIDETASAIRAAVRRAMTRHVAVARPAIGGDRHRDPDRRSRLARSVRRAAAAGGRHVSRHRHLRRQHRDPRRLGAGRVVGRCGFAAAGRRARAIVLLAAYAYIAGGGAVGDARDGDGGDLPGAARDRSADGAAACDGAHAGRAC